MNRRYEELLISVFGGNLELIETFKNIDVEETHMMKALGYRDYQELSEYLASDPNRAEIDFLSKAILEAAKTVESSPEFVGSVIAYGKNEPTIITRVENSLEFYQKFHK